MIQNKATSREATIRAEGSAEGFVEALTTLREFGWYLHMLWEDREGWGATIRDALAGTCEHHATARGRSPEDAIQSAIDRMAAEAFDEPETVTASAEPAPAASGLLALLGLGRPKPAIKRRKL